LGICRAEGWGEMGKRFFWQQCCLKEALLVQAKGEFRRKGKEERSGYFEFRLLAQTGL